MRNERKRKKGWCCVKPISRQNTSYTFQPTQHHNQHDLILCMLNLYWLNQLEVIKVHMTRKISHSKNTLISKAFKGRVKWRFSFCDIFFLFWRCSSFSIDVQI